MTAYLNNYDYYTLRKAFGYLFFFFPDEYLIVTPFLQLMNKAAVGLVFSSWGIICLPMFGNYYFWEMILFFKCSFRKMVSRNEIFSKISWTKYDLINCVETLVGKMFVDIQFTFWNYARLYWTQIISSSFENEFGIKLQMK